MKLFRILSHPYTVIICFLMIMISGEHLGGFYAMYILMALPFGGMHALLAVAGIALLLLGNALNRHNQLHRIINFVAIGFLFGSLYYFFWADKNHYNSATFERAIPMLTIVITVFVSLCFLFGSFIPKTNLKNIAT